MTPPFTLAGAVTGARAALVLSPTIVIFGAAFGMLAATRGLGIWEAVLMSALVCAGTAQLAVLQLWTDPMSWITAGIASLVMNSRYVLLGATLRGWFANLSAVRAYASLYFLYDTNWATAMRDHTNGYRDAAHLLGGGLLMCTIWTLATIGGHAFGRFLGDPRTYGLDFVISAFFAALAVTFWRGRNDLIPVAAAITAALVVDQLVTGPWYIVAGALVGSVVAALRYQPSSAMATDPKGDNRAA